MKRLLRACCLVFNLDLAEGGLHGDGPFFGSARPSWRIFQAFSAHLPGGPSARGRSRRDDEDALLQAFNAACALVFTGGLEACAPSRGLQACTSSEVNELCFCTPVVGVAFIWCCSWLLQ